MDRKFNGIPYLTYWDIFKNYYANKQETNAYVVHSGYNPSLYPTTIQTIYSGTTTTLLHNSGSSAITTHFGMQAKLTYDHNINPYGPETTNLPDIVISMDNGAVVKLTDIFQSGYIYGSNYIIVTIDDTGAPTYILEYWKLNATTALRLVQFPLANLDLMREEILAQPGNVQFEINGLSIDPYGMPMQGYSDATGTTVQPMTRPQEGLAVKTYQSDLLNNWIKTETQTYISNISAVSTAGGNFTIDTLNLANKVYNMLNRIAASGGTYEDWIETVWTNDTFKKAETPMYMGGLIKELSFQQIVSTASTQTVAGGSQPLGQLAGRGTLTSKHKGGKINIKVTEPSYITGIISLTPRVDYSQGNTWDVNLKTMDDFHKPELDEIGFQDLITEQMAWYGSKINSDGTVTMHSAGKQPAWVNYMTNVNRTYSNFAIELNEMFMTLNRRYQINQTTNDILDITTYIDPTKYNFIFAETKLDSQNFWVQIGNNIETRRKMSAKLIPNL